MRVYKESYRFTRPLTLAFLCGTKYDSANENDKRKILKKFLQSNISDCRALILEENFWFKKTTEKYLSYDEIFLRDLTQIEQMASLYADKIIVVDKGTILAAGTPAEIFSQTEMLEKCGLDVPDTVKIAMLLKEKGVPLTGSILTEEALAEEYLKILNS